MADIAKFDIEAYIQLDRDTHKYRPDLHCDGNVLAHCTAAALRDLYQALKSHAAAPPASANPVLEIAGHQYLKNAAGALIPVEQVKAADKLEDETVRKIMGFARDLSAQIARFKGHTFEDLNGLQSLFEQEYGAKAGGKKGNVTFQSFDGLSKVQVQIAEQISFGPQLQQAKTLIDECLIEWGAESRAEIRALVNRVFAVEKEGQINRAELFGLLRLDITDERWLRGMEAIRDSIRVTGTKAYLRFYERANAEAGWTAVTIDLAAA